VQPLPDPGLLPVSQAPPTRRAAAAAQLLRHQPPRAPRPQHEDDTRKGGAIRNPGAATLRFGRLFREERPDGFPEVVRDEG
jgi:hypothetical protein